LHLLSNTTVLFFQLLKNKINAMMKFRIHPLTPDQERDILNALTYKGKIAAMKVHMRHTGSRLRDARMAIERLSTTIEPGQAHSC